MSNINGSTRGKTVSRRNIAATVALALPIIGYVAPAAFSDDLSAAAATPTTAAAVSKTFVSNTAKNRDAQIKYPTVKTDDYNYSTLNRNKNDVTLNANSYATSLAKKDRAAAAKLPTYLNTTSPFLTENVMVRGEKKVKEIKVVGLTANGKTALCKASADVLCASMVNMSTPQQQVELNFNGSMSVVMRNSGAGNSNRARFDGVNVKVEKNVLTINDGAKSVSTKLPKTPKTVKVVADNSIVSVYFDGAKNPASRLATSVVTGDNIILGGVKLSTTQTYDKAVFTSSEPVLSNVSGFTNAQLGDTNMVVVAPGAAIVDGNGNGVLDFGEKMVYSYQVSGNKNSAYKNVGLNITGLPTGKDGKTVGYTVTRAASHKAGSKTVATAQWVPDASFFDSQKTVKLQTSATGVEQLKLYRDVTTTVNGKKVVSKQEYIKNVTEGSRSTVFNVPVNPYNQVVGSREVKLVKDVDGNGEIDFGDTIAASYTVTNTGSSTLSNFKTSDDALGESTSNVTVKPGEKVVLRSVEKVAGSKLVNSDVLRNGVKLSYGVVGCTKSSTCSGIANITSFNTVKVNSVHPSVKVVSTKVANLTRPAADSVMPGEKYEVTVTVGNDNKTSLTDISIGEGWVATSKVGSEWKPGENISYKKSGTATSDKVNTATLAETFTLTASPKLCGTGLCDEPLVAKVSETVKIDAQKISNVLTASTVSSYDAKTRSTTSTVTLSNKGNTTVKNVTGSSANTVGNILSTMVDGSGKNVDGNTPQSLAPGQKLVMQYVHKTTFEDLLSKKYVANFEYSFTPENCDKVADGIAATCEASTVTAPTSTVYDVLKPAVQVDATYKIVVDNNVAGKVDAGDTVEATYVIKNVGNLCVTNYAVNDETISKAVGEQAWNTAVKTAAAKQTSLCAGETLTFTVTGDPSEDDLVSGSYSGNVNVTVTPTFDDEGVTRNLPNLTVSTVSNKLLTAPLTGSLKVVSVEASVSVDGLTENEVDLNDSVSEQYAITNASNKALLLGAIKDKNGLNAKYAYGTQIYVNYDGEGEKVVSTVKAGSPVVLQPGQSVMMFGSYLADDASKLQSGTLSMTPNVEAKVSECSLCEQVGYVSSNSAKFVTVAPVKDVSLEPVTVEDGAPQTYKVTNTGNIVLRNIVVNDPQNGKIVCDQQKSLNPGDTTECVVQ